MHLFSYFCFAASSSPVTPAWELVAGGLCLGAVELVERRKRTNPLDPGRQIQLATLVESIPEAVFVIDQNGRIVETNAAAEGLTGLSKAGLKELPSDEVARYVADPDGLPADKRQFALYRALRGETVHQERRRLNRFGASTVEALVSASPMREPDGRIVGALVIVRDITELAQLQQYVAATERQNAIGSMAASLAHDFNNVLYTISNATTVLQVVPDRSQSERAAILRMIQNAVKRGSEIVGHVRQFLTGEMAQTGLLDLNGLLEDAIELTRPMWQKSGVSLVRQFQRVPRVEANATEMRRVFTNLILNALEAMKPAGGTLIVGCDYQEGKVRAFVEDTGEGIAPEQQEKIFVPFYTAKEQGTGLGLSSALRAVRAQRGNITFTSCPGEGSRFVVELPAADDGKVAA